MLQVVENTFVRSCIPFFKHRLQELLSLVSLLALALGCETIVEQRKNDRFFVCAY
jgi:hypothetical protein